MASGDAQLSQIEVLQQTNRVRIDRLRLPGLVVIRKEPLGPDAERRVRHELAMLERLRGLEGVAQLWTRHRRGRTAPSCSPTPTLQRFVTCRNRSRSTSCARSHRPWRSRGCTAAA